MDLTPEQAAAVTHGDGHAYILAGPGSGKTTVLVHRIRRLVDGPGEVIALTFTNKAVAELRERVDDERVRIRTFHALAKDILADTLGACIVASEPPPTDRALLQAALACTWPKVRGRCLAAYRQAMPGRDASAVDERATVLEADPRPFWVGYEKALADGAVEPAHLARRGQIPSWFRPWAEAAWRDWLVAKEATGTFHLDELVPWATRVIEAGHWDRPLCSVLVDELQDTSPDQWRLLVAFSRRAPLFAVGDPRQAIYGFRGADRRNASSFQQHFPGAARYELTVNHRSTQRIVAFANELLGSRIAAAPGAADGAPVTVHGVPVVGGKDGKVPTEEHLDAVLGGTLEVLEDALQDHEPGDVLVLGRDNRRLDRLAHYMQRRGIPCRRLTGEDGGDGVRIATVHAAKGLQAPVVIIMGFDSRGFPDMGLSPEERMELQRSLFVACTRAQQRLVVVRAEHPRIRPPAGLEPTARRWTPRPAPQAL